MKLKYKVEESDFFDSYRFDTRISQHQQFAFYMNLMGGIIGIPIFWFTIGKLGNMVISNADIVLTLIYLVFIIGRLFYTRSERVMKKIETRENMNKNYKELFDMGKHLYSKFFGEIVELEFNNEGLCRNVLGVEKQITPLEIEKVSETSNHFFIKPIERFSWVIPKRDLKNPNEIKSEFKRLGLEVEEHLDWKW